MRVRGAHIRNVHSELNREEPQCIEPTTTKNSDCASAEFSLRIHYTIPQCIASLHSHGIICGAVQCPVHDHMRMHVYIKDAKIIVKCVLRHIAIGV